MKAINRDTRAVLSHNPTSLLIKILWKEAKKCVHLHQINNKHGYE